MHYLLLFLITLHLLMPASTPAETTDRQLTPERLSHNVYLMNGVMAATILAWGYTNWDYGEKSPHTESEGWFGHNTKEGGADKLGHLYTGFILSHGAATLYRKWGYDRNSAALYGAGTSLMVTGLMEFGDSFSSYGFSYEDMIANTLGSVIGYYLYRDPSIQNTIDLRWEYRPEFHNMKGDFTTDYQHSKYLVAIKAEGFTAIRSKWLKALELQLGYYARNYNTYDESGPDERKRYLYVGIGLNIDRLIRSYSRTRLFHYLQVPYTYIEIRHKLED